MYFLLWGGREGGRESACCGFVDATRFESHRFCADVEVFRPCRVLIDVC